MITTFHIQNFRSILDLTLDFTYAEGKAPNGHQTSERVAFFDHAGKRPVPCVAFFGSRRLGQNKSSQGVFHAAKQLVVKGTELSDACESNLLNPKFSDSTLTLQFVIGEDLYEYCICFNHQKIAAESLQKNGQLLCQIHELESSFSAKILSENYSNSKLADIVRVECSDGEGHQTETIFAPRGTGLSWASSRTSAEYFSILETVWNFMPINMPLFSPTP